MAIPDALAKIIRSMLPSLQKPLAALPDCAIEFLLAADAWRSGYLLPGLESKLCFGNVKLLVIAFG